MEIKILENAQLLGETAAEKAIKEIRNAISENDRANIILATGASQFEMLKNLVESEIDWSKVVMFHLDEYINLPETHPASFRKYLKERFIKKVKNLKEACLVNGESGNPKEECRRLGDAINKHPVDVALVGIGENGHLAFNDPPADFEISEPYIIVELDESCRRQQLGEGWFKSLEEVPEKAISMSIKQIMKSKCIICSVPDKRKAEAVKNAVEKDISNIYPAGILRSHPNCYLYLDKEAGSLLSQNNVK